jgi:hypothetical protein
VSAEDEGREGRPLRDPRVGLCAECRHGRRQHNARGSVFVRCARARQDARFRPYPPLPVLACPGFERSEE